MNGLNGLVERTSVWDERFLLHPLNRRTSDELCRHAVRLGRSHVSALALPRTPGPLSGVARRAAPERVLRCCITAAPGISSWRKP